MKDGVPGCDYNFLGMQRSSVVGTGAESRFNGRIPRVTVEVRNPPAPAGAAGPVAPVPKPE
jgi:hypothetical protein